MAPSGIAAVNIGGETCDSMCKLQSTSTNFSLSTLASWEYVLLVILDEFSMCGQSKFAKIELHLRCLKANQAAFGGVGFVLMGDHFQQPPVQDRALWLPPQQGSSNNKFHQQFQGHQLYRSFNQCFYLTETNRFTADPILGYHLGNARYGLYSVGFRALINKQTLSPTHWNQIISLPSPPVIGTHSNVFRYHIINAFITKRSTESSLESNPTFRIMALLTSNGSPITDPSLRTKIYRAPPNKCDMYHPILDIYVGMPVLVTKNISVDIGIANGSHAVIQNIVFPPTTTFSIIITTSGAFVKLPSQHPLYILLKITDSVITCNFHTLRTPSATSNNPPPLPLEPGVFPITTSTKTINKLKIYKIDVKFNLTQFPISPSFALTDFKLQGSTLNSMILSPFTIDNNLIPNIGNTRKISGPSLYVLLSRVRQLQHFWLTSPAQANIFKGSRPSESTILEDDRLISLAISTTTFPPNTPRVLTYAERLASYKNPPPL